MVNKRQLIVVKVLELNIAVRTFKFQVIEILKSQQYQGVAIYTVLRPLAHVLRIFCAV